MKISDATEQLSLIYGRTLTPEEARNLRDQVSRELCAPATWNDVLELARSETQPQTGEAALRTMLEIHSGVSQSSQPLVPGLGGSITSGKSVSRALRRDVEDQVIYRIGRER